MLHSHARGVPAARALVRQLKHKQPEPPKTEWRRVPTAFWLARATDGKGHHDGAREYDGSKVYKDSKLANILFCREAARRWPRLAVRSLSPGFIPSSGLFREPRKDNWIGATAFTFVAGLAGFAVPIDVGGQRLAFMATASDDDIPPGSYLAGPTGSKGFTRDDGFDDGIISAEAKDAAKAAALWDCSREIVGC